MSELFFENRKFQKADFIDHPPEIGEYEDCIFEGCNFSNLDISNFNFVSCQFVSCDLSLAKINHTAFRDVDFTDCKMLGLRFEDCNSFLFSISFDRCQLNLSSFYKCKLKKTSFTGCSLHETDFTESDLSASKFKTCDFTGAMFDRTNLEKADLRSSINFQIDPENNRIKKAKFSQSEIMGLLTKYDIVID